MTLLCYFYYTFSAAIKTAAVMWNRPIKCVSLKRHQCNLNPLTESSVSILSPGIAHSGLVSCQLWPNVDGVTVPRLGDSLQSLLPPSRLARLVSQLPNIFVTFPRSLPGRSDTGFLSSDLFSLFLLCRKSILLIAFFRKLVSNITYITLTTA